MYKYFIKGVVQGVGFRPYIYKKAIELKLVGTVKNTGCGVEVVCNDPDFEKKLNDKPPLSHIESITKERLKKQKGSEYTKFLILESTIGNSLKETTLPADIFMCDDCKKELRDKKNRRYNYYYITCTNCGPRFSMIEDYPYDRPKTSMKEFAMCDDCHKEYTNPMNRRYHAQTIACKNCGPSLQFFEKDKQHNKFVNYTKKSDELTIKIAMKQLKNGSFISIKGIGGFHLCSKADGQSVLKVRNFLKRYNKPFAIMCKDLDMIEKFAHIDELEKNILLSKERPIVIVKKKDINAFKEVSELDTVGVILPYTALHYLLFDFISKPLLMTSCNIPGEPVLTEESYGNYFLTHNREIVNRCDDSVIKVINDHKTFLRRSRGFVPLPININLECKDTLALGAELNCVVCSVKNKNAYLSQYIGETSKVKTLKFFKDTIDKMIDLTRSNPKIIACDLHPEYNSTKLAINLAKKHNAKLIKIQHHEAHVASVAAEHNLDECFGIAMDGLGYGRDKNLWGGEIFYFEKEDFKNNMKMKRIGHLEEQVQIGGDSATINPKKMLFGILKKFMSNLEIERLNKKIKIYESNEIKTLSKMLYNNFNTITTTSAGRILDSVATLLNICNFRDYDGRPAMLLESKSDKKVSNLKLEPVVKKIDGKLVLMTTPIFQFIIKNLDKERKKLAFLAQNYLAKGSLLLIEKYKEDKNLKNKDIKTVFSGGVTYNSIITTELTNNEVLINKSVPAGDGGICLGQAYLANILK